jgi:hypothetical protein
LSRQPKKMLAMQILDVLNRHSDAEHRLSQQDIARLLEKDHQVKADRGTIRRNLSRLVEYGYDIEWTEIPRGGPRGEESAICTDWYILRLFDDSELRLLIDCLFFSRYVPAGAGREMIDKLLTLTSRHFKAGVSSLMGIQEKTLTNPQLFYTIQVLDEAISKRRQVAFLYNSIGLDMKLSPRLGRRGHPIRYLVNPYRMVVANGRHYLIGNHDRHDNIAHLRIDRITEIELKEKAAKPLSQVEGMEKGLSLPAHMAEHIYMFSGPSERVVFRTDVGMMDSIVDWFGTEVKVTEIGKNMMEVSVRVNREAMRYWALQYARYVTLLSPEDLVKEVRNDLMEAAGRYER